MHLQFLTEDRSGAELVGAVMKQLLPAHPATTYDCKPFHGIGGFPRRNTARESKTGQLLNDLSIYLRGFSKSFQHYVAVIIVVLNNDDRDTEMFYTQLNQLVADNGVNVESVFCVAVEELEAWLLGDEPAILKAYPHAKLQAKKTYIQDSICGTWEVLADVLYKGGSAKLKKEAAFYAEIGMLKCEWARNIGQYLDLHNNASPSFQRFLSAIETHLDPA